MDNRLLEDVADTAPFKWNGANPNLETECGPRTEKFFYRSESYDGWELADLVTLHQVDAAPAQPLPAANGELTAAQERGKAIFERDAQQGWRADSGGESVPRLPLRAALHQPADVRCGTGKPTDRSPADRHSAVEQHRADRAVSARRFGAHPRGDLDCVQPRRTGTG